MDRPKSHGAGFERRCNVGRAEVVADEQQRRILRRGKAVGKHIAEVGMDTDRPEMVAVP